MVRLSACFRRHLSVVSVCFCLSFCRFLFAFLFIFIGLTLYQLVYVGHFSISFVRLSPLSACLCLSLLFFPSLFVFLCWSFSLSAFRLSYELVICVVCRSVSVCLSVYFCCSLPFYPSFYVDHFLSLLFVCFPCACHSCLFLALCLFIFRFIFVALSVSIRLSVLVIFCLCCSSVSCKLVVLSFVCPSVCLPDPAGPAVYISLH